MLLQLQDSGTSLSQLQDHATSLSNRLKGRGLLTVKSEAPKIIFFCCAGCRLWPVAPHGRPVCRAPIGSDREVDRTRRQRRERAADDPQRKQHERCTTNAGGAGREKESCYAALNKWGGKCQMEMSHMNVLSRAPVNARSFFGKGFVLALALCSPI
jgi:hypothetical protein